MAPTHACGRPRVGCARARDEVGHTGHPRFVIATTILASSLAFVDGSVVNVGLSAIGASFRADADDLQWVVNAYLLPLSALLLLGGAAGDRFGRRRLLIAGVGLFGVASLACAAAPSLLWLLVARFVQGVSAAMLMPSSLAILGQSFSGEAKPCDRYLGRGRSSCGRIRSGAGGLAHRCRQLAVRFSDQSAACCSGHRPCVPVPQCGL